MLMLAGVIGAILALPIPPLAIAFGVLAVYGLLDWLRALIVARTTELAVTSFRVIAKSGLVRRQTVEQLLNRIDSIEVNQSLLGRLLGYGSVTIIGTGVTHTPIALISDPLGFRRAVHTAIEQHPQNQTAAPAGLTAGHQ